MRCRVIRRWVWFCNGQTSRFDVDGRFSGGCRRGGRLVLTGFTLFEGHELAHLGSAVIPNVIGFRAVEHGFRGRARELLLDDVRGPAGHPGDGKHRCEQIDGDAQVLIHGSAVKIDVYGDIGVLALAEDFLGGLLDQG